jgi:hypothetical protein
VVFEGPNGTFSSISAVDIGWRQLGINVVIRQVLEEGMGGFIVQTLELGLEATGEKKLVSLLKCIKNVGG